MVQDSKETDIEAAHDERKSGNARNVEMESKALESPLYRDETEKDLPELVSTHYHDLETIANRV